jgi:hypothetical protein
LQGPFPEIADFRLSSPTLVPPFLAKQGENELSSVKIEYLEILESQGFYQVCVKLSEGIEKVSFLIRNQQVAGSNPIAGSIISICYLVIIDAYFLLWATLWGKLPF